MKTPNKALVSKKVKSLVQPRNKANQQVEVDLSSLCGTNRASCYRRNRSIESEDDILF